MAGAPPPPALLTLPDSSSRAQVALLGKGSLRARPGRSLTALLSLTAGQVREGSEPGAGLPRGLWHCCPHPLGAGSLGSTASPLIPPVTSQGTVSLRRAENSARYT